MLTKLLKIYTAITMGRKGGYYAVRTGRQTGVFQTWEECERYVKGFPGARYKKFSTQDEAKSFVVGSDSGYSASYSYAASTYCGSRKRSWNDFSENSSYNPRGYEHFKPSYPSFSSSSSSSSLSPSSLFSSSSSTASSSDSRPVVYTDGCCTKNGRKGARAGIGVYWGPGNSRNVSDRLEGKQTNQRAEIMAAVTALETAKDMGLKTLEIKTDSTYTIKGATDWCLRWKKNGWKTVNGTEVQNKDEFQKLSKLCDEVDVKWTHVPGHRGIEGNEAADSLAKTGADK